MIGHIAYAEGSPGPTLVLDLDALPTAEGELGSILHEARRWLRSAGAAHVLKIALIAPSRHPLFDLDYKFVQCLPGELERFDFRGSCGHSILAAITVASQRGWLPKLFPTARVRVKVLNNGDRVVCEVDEVDRETSTFTVHFLHEPTPRLTDLLLTGEPTTTLCTDSGRYETSLVSMGNPYVFVRASECGVATREQLFADDLRLYERLAEIRRAAAVRLGWSPEGAFPKVAALASFRPGVVSVRALSVPKWHPSLALTGATCLGAAARIEGSVAHSLGEHRNDTALEIETTSGNTAVSTAVLPGPHGPVLGWASVSRKLARFQGAVSITTLPNYVLKEAELCFPQQM